MTNTPIPLRDLRPDGATALDRRGDPGSARPRVVFARPKAAWCVDLDGDGTLEVAAVIHMDGPFGPSPNLISSADGLLGSRRPPGAGGSSWPSRPRITRRRACSELLAPRFAKLDGEADSTSYQPCRCRPRACCSASSWGLRRAGRSPPLEPPPSAPGLAEPDQHDPARGGPGRLRTATGGSTSPPWTTSPASRIAWSSRPSALAISGRPPRRPRPAACSASPGRSRTGGRCMMARVGPSWPTSTAAVGPSSCAVDPRRVGQEDHPRQGPRRGAPAWNPGDGPGTLAAFSLFARDLDGDGGDEIARILPIDLDGEHRGGLRRRPGAALWTRSFEGQARIRRSRPAIRPDRPASWWAAYATPCSLDGRDRSDPLAGQGRGTTSGRPATTCCCSTLPAPRLQPPRHSPAS